MDADGYKNYSNFHKSVPYEGNTLTITYPKGYTPYNAPYMCYAPVRGIDLTPGSSDKRFDDWTEDKDGKIPTDFYTYNPKQDGKDAKDGIKSSNFSIAYGLSYEFKNGITLDWRAAIGLTTINKVSDEQNKFRSNCATLTIGYKFNL